MSRLLASVLAAASFAAAAQGQFPLGPGPLPPQPIVDPAINEYICRSVVEHAISATLAPIRATAVELVSSRWQGELVYVFSRVYWTRHHAWRKPVQHVAEVQYSMVQRRFNRRVYDLYLCNTSPIIYQYYDLGRVRTRINEELERFDKIAGDSIFPGPWPRGPSTVVPQISTSTLNAPPTVNGQPAGQPAKPLDELYGPPPPLVPPVAAPPINVVPAPRPAVNQNVPAGPIPRSSTGSTPPSPALPNGREQDPPEERDMNMSDREALKGAAGSTRAKAPAIAGGMGKRSGTLAR